MSKSRSRSRVGQFDYETGIETPGGAFTDREQGLFVAQDVQVSFHRLAR
jgi:hypothetical protein